MRGRYNPGVRTIIVIPVFLIASLLYGCGSSATSDNLRIRDITLPDGQVIHAEVSVTQQDLTRGLMYRDSLPGDRGMLYVYPQPGLFPRFLYHYEIPVDMVWLDAARKVVEIEPDAPPCKTSASACPHYGGTILSQYVLEMGAGMAARHRVEKGSQLSF
jgi:uncharacterized membrane protein (UPF0127 family)